MKKIIIFFSIAVLITGMCYCILKDYNSIDKVDVPNNTLVSIDIGNILVVRMREGTEGGYIYYKTENKETIEKIYNALKNLKIGREADINVVDDTRDYIFELDDGTEKIYSFQSTFYYKNSKTYETFNYKELKKIEIPKIDSWE